MTTEEVLDRFEAEYLAPNSITPARRHQQKVMLRHLAASIAPRPLTEVTGADANVFIGQELKRGLHVNTCRKYVGMLHSFAKWGMDSGVLTHANDLTTVRNPRGSTSLNRPRPYKPEEIRQLYAAVAAKYPAMPAYGPGSRSLQRYLSGRQRSFHGAVWSHARRLQLEAQIALALELGLRRIEILHMTIPALHYDNEQVVVLTAKQGPGNEVTRVLPYPAHARKVMQEWLDFRWLLAPVHESPWLLLTHGTGIAPLAPQTLGALARSLGDLGYGWHRLRHTCATEWLRAKVPLEKVRLYMGHSNIEQTLAYAEIISSDMDEAFARADEDFARRLGLAA